MPYIFRRASGNLSVDYPTRTLTPEQEAKHIARLELEHGWTYLGKVDARDLPTKGKLRNAWRFAGGRVAVDIPEARKLRKAQILEERGRLDPQDARDIDALDSESALENFKPRGR